MTIRLCIDLNNIPELEAMSDNGELQQVLFDAVVNYVTVSHLRDSTRAHARTETFLEGSDSRTTCEQLAEYHESWAEIMSGASFTYSRI